MFKWLKKLLRRSEPTLADNIRSALRGSYIEPVIIEQAIARGERWAIAQPERTNMDGIIHRCAAWARMEQRLRSGLKGH